MTHERPDRKSFAYMLYVDLVIGKKTFVRKQELFARVSEKFGCSKRRVIQVYDRYVRPQLRDGRPVRELF